jgi:uncharacterized repeat protein (TIGR01451 family)
VDAGSVTNTATASGTAPSGAAVTSDPSPATVTAAQAPGLGLVKTADPLSYDTAGQEITYSYDVTNTGNVTIHGLAVAEAGFSGAESLSAITCPPTTLGPEDSTTCTATYHITQADLDAGHLTNTATGSGVSPEGLPVTSGPSTITIYAASGPAITLTKSADPVSYDKAGQQIDYAFAIINTGNVDLTGIAVDDTEFSGTGTLSAIDCPSATLTVSAKETCTATYHVTQADLDAGHVTNTATARGSAPDGAPVLSGPSAVTITAARGPAITVVKSASPVSFDKVGQAINYRYRATNTGNVTLHSVRVLDALPGLSAIHCPSTTLAVGAAETCNATDHVTQADLDAGTLKNTASDEGDPPGSTTPVLSRPSSVTVKGVRQAVITLVKSADLVSFDRVGQVIGYRFRVTNAGNVTLHSVRVLDAMRGLSALRCPTTVLAPGKAETCTATYHVTQAELDAGTLKNTAEDEGDPPGSTTPVLSRPSTVTIKGLPEVPVTG